MAPTSNPKLRRLLPRLILVGLILGLALFAPFLTDQDPVKMNIAERLQPPSLDHYLGQDEYGRDILARLLYGARVSLAVALLAAAAAGVIGVAIGLFGGYFGGIVELFTVRLTDIVLSFPPMLLALLIVTILGPGAETLTLVLIILYTPGYARVAYGETLSVRSVEYVEASRALGAQAGRILFLTILPNISGPIIVQFSLTVASAILIESGLSFLGLGVVPPDSSWGLMIRAARGYMVYSPLPLLWPCLALTVTVLAVNALCDALRDIYDPKGAHEGGLLQAARSLVRFPVADGREAAKSADEQQDEPQLAVSDLRIEFATPQGAFAAVDGISFNVGQGETVAVVGESGSGKTMTGLSILKLIPGPHGSVTRGSIALRSKDGAVLPIERLDEKSLEAVRGNEVAMVFQEPMTSLNPVYPVGEQIAEALRQHRESGRREALARAVELLGRVGIPDADRRVRDYPHQMSGGMRQRVMIAIALSCHPALLVADEPTTALDVTVQAQILELFQHLRDAGDSDLGLLFITHNLGVVAEIADRVLVMYCGRIVEEGPVREVFRDPRHPYTRGLLSSIPRVDAATGERVPLAAIPGTVPGPGERRQGCAFAPRCVFAEPRCEVEDPPAVTFAPGRSTRCLRWEALGSMSGQDQSLTASSAATSGREAGS